MTTHHSPLPHVTQMTTYQNRFVESQCHTKLDNVMCHKILAVYSIDEVEFMYLGRVSLFRLV